MEADLGISGAFVVFAVFVAPVVFVAIVLWNFSKMTIAIANLCNVLANDIERRAKDEANKKRLG